MTVFVVYAEEWDGCSPPLAVYNTRALAEAHVEADAFYLSISELEVREVTCASEVEGPENRDSDRGASS